MPCTQVTIITSFQWGWPTTNIGALQIWVDLQVFGEVSLVINMHSTFLELNWKISCLNYVQALYTRQGWHLILLSLLEFIFLHSCCVYMCMHTPFQWVVGKSKGLQFGYSVIITMIWHYNFFEISLWLVSFVSWVFDWWVRLSCINMFLHSIHLTIFMWV
jgi:hypothetical protein